MVGALAGDQWNEGDVSCSVVRRVALPGAMFAIDGLLETFITVVGELEAFPGPIGAELERVAPFLATTTVLMEAVKAGAGREAAHEAIKQHTVALARELRAGTGDPATLVERLASDQRIGLSTQAVVKALQVDERFTGAALAQADAFVGQAAALADRVPDAAGYVPGEIL